MALEQDGSTTELTSEITVSNATEKIETPLVLQSSRYGQAATFSPPIVVIIWVVCCWYCVCRRYCEKKTQNVIMNQNTTATATPAAPQVILQQPIVNQNIAASPQQVPMQQWAPQPPPQPWAPQLPPQQGDPQPPPQQFGIPNV
ncbi:hypothetical protein CEXT_209881 [Caerostris extrusa]|uniref:Uncharacterized protein n=1 Tax=Caerostris extrusa TaxID=172846 RepID=A0AAV4X085_CAEEX|nr:hypothetical protein CEXT_209881 [Caerostris extrusa]